MLFKAFLTPLSTATNWPVLRECGQEPLQFNCETLLQVLKADLHLAYRDDSCWSAHVSKALSTHSRRFGTADALNPQEVNRNAVTNHHWCGKPLKETARTPFCITSNLFKDMDKGVMRNVSRFRLHAHCLKVESCKWLGGSDICDKCSRGEQEKKSPG
eukprot:1145608-Pelagomonas_calceolata.AAC.1